MADKTSNGTANGIISDVVCGIFNGISDRMTNRIASGIASGITDGIAIGIANGILNSPTGLFPESFRKKMVMAPEKATQPHCAHSLCHAKAEERLSSSPLPSATQHYHC